MGQIALAHAAAATAALSAGAAVVATRLVIGETDPATLVLCRYAISLLCFAPFVAALWPQDDLAFLDYAKIGVLGLLFFGLFPWAFNASLQYIPAARGAVGLATIPIQTMLVAAAFGRERLTWGKLIGVALAFAGIAVAFGPAALTHEGSGTLRGDALMLLGGTCAAVYSVFGRATLMRHGPLFVTALAMAFAVAAALAVVAMQTGGVGWPAFTARGWIAVILLGTVGGAVQFSLFMWALRWLSPTTTVLYLTLNPIAATILGTLVLGEPLTIGVAAGMAFVLTGIVVGSGALSSIIQRRPK